jgi:hypothetical protein
MIRVRSCGQAAAYRGERLHNPQRFLDAVLPGEPSEEAIEHVAIDWLAGRLYRLGGIPSFYLMESAFGIVDHEQKDH